MIANLDDIRNPVDQTLRPMGFRSKAKRMWDRQADRVIQVVHLDKSSYGPQNRLEIFFSLADFIETSEYKLSDFDVRLNFDRVVANAAEFRSALDQEKAYMASDVRAEIIQATLDRSLEPLLKLAVDKQGFAGSGNSFRAKTTSKSSRGQL